MVLRLFLLAWASLWVSAAEGFDDQPSGGAMGPFYRYAEKIVGLVALRPLPQHIIYETVEGQSVEDLATIWKPYYTPWAIAIGSIIVVATTFAIVYLLHLCISCICGNKGVKKDKKGLKRIYNGFLFVLAILTIIFTGIATYGIIRGTWAHEKLPSNIDNFANDLDAYILDNCDIIKENFTPDALKSVESVRDNILMSVNKLADNLEEKLRDELSPIYKIQDSIALLNNISTDNLKEFKNLTTDTSPQLHELLQGKRVIDDIANAVVVERDLEKFREFEFEADPEILLNSVRKQFVQNGNELFKDFESQFHSLVNETRKSILKSFCSDKNQFTRPLKQFSKDYKTNVGPYTQYPYYTTIVLVVILLFTCLLAFLGIAFSISTNHSTSRKVVGPRTFYNTSMGLALISLILTAFLGSAMFLPFGVATDLVCDPWLHPEERTEILHGLDYLIEKRWGNSLDFLGNTKGVVSRVVEECSPETKLLQILKLTDKFVVDQTNITSYLEDIKAELKKGFHLPNDVKLDDEHISYLTNISKLWEAEFHDINVTETEQKVGGELLPQDNRSLYAYIKMAEFIQHAKTLPTDDDVNKTQSLLTQKRINELADPLIQTLLDNTEVLIVQQLNSIKSKVEDEVLECDTLRGIVVHLRSTVCDDMVDSHNAVWLALFHIEVFLMGFIAVGGCLSKLHQRI